jgi:hypothetical protein
MIGDGVTDMEAKPPAVSYKGAPAPWEWTDLSGWKLAVDPLIPALSFASPT